MNNYENLNQVRDMVRAEIAMRADGVNAKPSKYKKQIMVCAGTGCISSKSLPLIQSLQDNLKENGLSEEVEVVPTGCFGLCAQGPIVIVYPEETFYQSVQADDAKEIVESHIKGSKLVDRLLYRDTPGADPIEKLDDTPFYQKQRRVALRNCGRINPEKIEEYIAFDGYQAIAKILQNGDPNYVIETLKKSEIRGRGGAGFPTFMKWTFAKNAVGDQKYVLCNADEGDPGAFMDRSILEGDPHAIIEAMTIAGFTIGADQGYVYVRAEYPIAVARFRLALDQAREHGFLGKNIFGSDFSFDIGIRLGAGAFVCGEETALIASVEGNRGEPRPRPPFPAVKGLFDQPTIVNNVETYANIPQIILKGPEWFTSMGTEKSKGTKVFAVGGNIKNVGLVEVPMGTTLREVVEDIGGGVPNGKKFKAAQTGGPSGGCIPAHLIDTPIDFDNLIAIGSMMGSGGLIVMDEDNCMVDIAKFFLEFTVEESCGKCVPCRIGTKRLYEMLDKITKGKATIEDVDKMIELCYHIKENSLCALGQTAPNPILSTYEYFKDEYMAHVIDKKCPAGVCEDLLTYKVIDEKCIGCTLCARNCPVNAIAGVVKEPHYIDPDICIKCGICIEKCKFDAIIVE